MLVLPFCLPYYGAHTRRVVLATDSSVRYCVERDPPGVDPSTAEATPHILAAKPYKKVEIVVGGTSDLEFN